jgi:hypothetical protein
MSKDEIKWTSFSAKGGETFTARGTGKACIISPCEGPGFTSVFFENHRDPMPASPLTPTSRAEWVAWADAKATVTSAGDSWFAEVEEAKGEAEEWLAYGYPADQGDLTVFEVLLTVAVDLAEVNHPAEWNWQELIEEDVDVISVDCVDGEDEYEDEEGYEGEDDAICGWYLDTEAGGVIEWNHIDGRRCRVAGFQFSLELHAPDAEKVEKFVRKYEDNGDLPESAIVANSAQILWVESLQRQRAACLEVVQ